MFEFLKRENSGSSMKKAFRDILDKIVCQTFKIRDRKSERDFTRTRKLWFVEIILFQISTASKTLCLELNKYLTSKKISAIEYNKQAYSKAKIKIKHSGYIELYDSLLAENYKYEDYKAYKNYRFGV